MTQGNPIRRIAINTGGGDAPGLNAVIRGVVLSALRRGWEVLGVREGYRGLIEPGDRYLVQLNRDAVRGIGHLGGTILGTTNRGDPFNYPVQREGQLVATDVSDRVIARFRELELDALVAVGGDGSMTLAQKLLERGLPRVVGIPKTIDNDLMGTDVTFGFQTAVATATDALDKLHSTAQSHRRVIVVEVMGRYAGWIALHAAVAGGADVVLIPEIPYQRAPVREKILRRYRRGREFALVVVAEGALPEGGAMSFAGEASAFKEHDRLVGAGEHVAQWIAEETGCETRSLVLGHLQRGGSPVTFDRVLSQQLATAATRTLAESSGSGLIAMVGGGTRLVPLADVGGQTRCVDPGCELVQTARAMGLSLGDEQPSVFMGA